MTPGYVICLFYVKEYRYSLFFVGHAGFDMVAQLNKIIHGWPVFMVATLDFSEEFIKLKLEIIWASTVDRYPK